MFQHFRVLLFALIFVQGCGYGFVTLQDTLPGGIKKVSIPTFENRTHEAGLENIFTAALRNEFFKSKIVEVVATSEAEAEIRGTISGVHISSAAHSERSLDGRASKVLANQYTAKVDVDVSLVRLSDKKVIWTRTLTDEREYVTGENLLKNEVQQQAAFNRISTYLMEQSHDLMFENF